MVGNKCLETYTQPITTIITAVNYDLLKKMFKLTPPNLVS